MAEPKGQTFSSSNLRVGVNTFKCFTHVGHGEGEAQFLLAGHNSGTVLSSKRANRVFSFSGCVASVSVT